MAVDDLRKSPTMANLLDALDGGKDIGHYGKFVFATVATKFMDDDEVVQWLVKAPDTDEEKARSLVSQVEGRSYNPPRREKLLEYQAQQDFQLVPNPDDPDSGNLYRELQFPDDVYEDISEYHEEKTSSR